MEEAPITPLEFLEAVYTDEGLELPVRLRAATAAAPFVHPKLQAIAHFDGGSLAERMERAGRMRDARRIVRGELTIGQCRLTPSEEELALAQANPQEPKPVYDDSPLGRKLALAAKRVEGIEQARAEGRVAEFARKVIEVEARVKGF